MIAAISHAFLAVHALLPDGLQLTYAQEEKRMKTGMELYAGTDRKNDVSGSENFIRKWKRRQRLASPEIIQTGKDIKERRES